MPRQAWIAKAGIMRVAALAWSITTVLTVVPAPQSSASDAPQAGLWKITVNHQSGNVPAQLQNQCITQDMVNNLGKGFGLPNCKQRSAWDGSTLRSRLDCQDPKATNATVMLLEITFDTPQHYSGSITSIGFASGRSADATVSVEGQRVGACGN
jgi:Protein of unknown function (DUF3617)